MDRKVANELFSFLALVGDTLPQDQASLPVFAKYYHPRSLCVIVALRAGYVEVVKGGYQLTFAGTRSFILQYLERNGSCSIHALYHDVLEHTPYAFIEQSLKVLHQEKGLIEVVWERDSVTLSPKGKEELYINWPLLHKIQQQLQRGPLTSDQLNAMGSPTEVGDALNVLCAWGAATPYRHELRAV